MAGPLLSNHLYNNRTEAIKSKKRSLPRDFGRKTSYDRKDVFKDQGNLEQRLNFLIHSQEVVVALAALVLCLLI